MNTNQKFYVISLCHSTLDEKYITIWRNDNAGYSFLVKEEYAYSEITEGYHNSDSNMAIEKEKLEALTIKVNGELRVPNCKAVWEALDIKPDRKGKCLARKEKYTAKS